jgi:hypothetical protein
MVKRPDLECVGLGGKAGGLRTAALVLRRLEEKGSDVSLSWIAEQFEAAADKCDREALAFMPFAESEKQ